MSGLAAIRRILFPPFGAVSGIANFGKVFLLICTGLVAVFLLAISYYFYGFQGEFPMWEIAGRVLLSSGAVACLTVACLYWILVGFLAVRLFTPSHAALVPNMRRRMRQAAGLYVFLTAGAVAVWFAWFTSDTPWQWIFVALALFLTSFVLIVRTGYANFLPLGFVFGASAVAERWPGGLDPFANWIAVGSTALIGFAIWWTFGLRGDAHLARFAKLNKQAQAMSNPATSENPMHLGLAWFQRPFARLQDRQIRANQQSPEQPMGSLLPLALGPSFNALPGVGTIFAATFLAGLLSLGAAALPWTEEIRIGVLMFTAMWIFGNVSNGRIFAAHRLLTGRGEQSLIALAERTPPMTQQSAVFQSHFLRNSFVLWIVATACMLFVYWVCAPQLPWAGSVLAAAFGMLPGHIIFVRDYASATPTVEIASGRLGVLMLDFAGAFVGAIWIGKLGSTAILLWCAGLAALTLLAGAWRLRAAQHGGIQFPTGRAA